MSEMDVSKIFPGWAAEGVLGSGEFGTVYLIRNGESGAFSSMKVLRVPPTPEAIDNAVKMGVGRDLLTTYFTKFKNDLSWEIAMYGNVKTPGLAPVEEFKTASLNGPGWLGFLRSGIYTPISTYFEKTPSTPEDAVRMGMELSDGLEALTPYGMVHGDIKPENVMVTDAGGFVLTDYAIRRCLERAGSGLFDAGDQGFDAPETVGRDRVYSVRSDIYSLGALMCWTANGGSMPEHSDPNKIKNIDPALANVIKKAMAADPNQRYQTGAQLKADLTKLGLPKKQPRRAMAAAAAFEAVKRNGGSVMTGARTEDKPASGPEDRPSKPAAGTKEKSSGAKGKSAGTKDKRAGAKAKDDPAPAASSTAYDFTQSEHDRASGGKKDDTGIKKSKAGWVVGAVALLACLAVILVIWTPWKKDVADDNGDLGTGGQIHTGDNTGTGGNENGGDKDDTGEDKDAGAQTGDTGGDKETGDGDTGSGENDGDNTGDLPGGEDQPGENNDDGGNETDTPVQPGPGGDGGNAGENGDGSGDGAGSVRPEAVNNDVLFPTDSQRIMRSDLEGKDRSATYMLVNEIYARHGYIFGGEDSTIQRYFNSQKWYEPVTSDASQVEKTFTDLESANLKTITDYQREMGWRDGGTSSGSGNGSEGGSTGTVRPEAVNNDTLYPSDTQRITRAELEGKTRSETAMLINEIYARHGYIFKSGGDADKYFRSQKWYTPVTSSNSKVEGLFNPTEKANITTLTDYQKEMGWREGQPSTAGAGTTTPDTGTTTPDTGTTTPDEGTTTPDTGTTTPDEGSTTPDTGTTTPDEGTTTPDTGTTTPDEGTTTPDEGTTTPDAGTTTPDEGTTTPDTGTTTPDEGTTTPDEGTTTPDTGTTTPDEGTTTTPDEGSTAPTGNGYLFPSNTRLITRADLEGKSKDDVLLILNEIYARHGYIFSTQSLKDYFTNQQWYTPVTGNINVVVGMLNETERANASFLDDYMHEMGWR